MHDLGAPTTLPPALHSHTSTEQWQSFEIRMRHRRADRCVLRAEIALEAGFEEDARAALEEARRLTSGTPDLETLRAVVAERLAATLAAEGAIRRRRAAGIAAAALLVLTTAGGVFWFSRPEPPAATSLAATETIPPPMAAQPPATPAEAPVQLPAAVATAGEAAPPAVAEEPGTKTPVRDRAAPAAETRTRETTPPARPPAAAPTPRLPASEPPARRVTPAAVAEPPPPVATAVAPPASAPIEQLVETLPAADVPRETRETPAAPAPPRTEPAPIAEEPRVRAVLARYESAYSGLNASAAQAVWPGVDERSLARAFDSLESQRLSLGRCSVQVQDRTARADCSGSVTWTPKVGGGAQSASRRWSFELANANGAWQIMRAEAK